MINYLSDPRTKKLLQVIGLLTSFLEEGETGQEVPETGQKKGKLGRKPYTRKWKMICSDCGEKFVWKAESTLDAVCPACKSIHVVKFT